MTSEPLKLYLLSLSKVHLSFLIGQTAAFGIAVLVNKKGIVEPILAGMHAVYAGFVTVSAVIIAAGLFVQRNRLSAVSSQIQLADKLNEYRKMLILNYSLFQAAALIVILGFVFTGSTYFSYLSMALIFVFFINRPTEARIKSQLKLNTLESSLSQNGSS